MFKPLGQRVLIKPLEQKESKSGLTMPEPDREKPATGLVIATGSKVESVNKNNEVLYPRYVVENIEVDGDQYVIVKEEDIIGVLR